MCACLYRLTRKSCPKYRGSTCLGNSLSLVRVVLDSSCTGYELSCVWFVQILPQLSCTLVAGRPVAQRNWQPVTYTKSQIPLPGPWTRLEDKLGNPFSCWLVQEIPGPIVVQATPLCLIMNAMNLSQWTYMMVQGPHIKTCRSMKKI